MCVHESLGREESDGFFNGGMSLEGLISGILARLYFDVAKDFEPRWPSDQRV